MDILKECTPILIELIKTGKTIGLAYFAVLGLVPVVTLSIKAYVVYAVVKLIADVIKYLFGEEDEKATKKK